MYINVFFLVEDFLSCIVGNLIMRIRLNELYKLCLERISSCNLIIILDVVFGGYK
jgi:hypothetical protein